MKIIAFSGKKQSGKTTAAEFLKTKTNVADASFADGLKYVVGFCFDDEIAVDWTYPTKESKDRVLGCGKSIREMLQLVGTDWFRSVDSRCWIRTFKRRILGLEISAAPDLVVVVPDVRFPNEVKCIQDLGGHVIRLLRAPFPDDKHESETALDLAAEYTIASLGEKAHIEALRKHIGFLFDAIIDNREMTIAERNEAIWKLINERGWV